MEEKDLYGPVKALFEQLDYEVYGEVNTIDVVAQKEGEVIAIELKKDLNLHLIAQGAYRQRLTDYVYLAIPTPTGRVQRGSAFKDKVYIMRRLGVGLIYVSLGKKKASARIVYEPNMIDIKAAQRRSKKKRLNLKKELSQRTEDWNVGGTNGKIMTAYRMSALKILKCLEDGEPHKTTEIRLETGNTKATRIMYTNHYGWFESVARGEYKITEAGLAALDKYKEFLS